MKEYNSSAIILANYYLGYTYDVIKQKSLVGLVYYFDAIKEYELNPNDKSSTYYLNIVQNTGVIFERFSQMEIARDFYFKSLKISDQKNNLAIMARSLWLIAETYDINEDEFYLYSDSAIAVGSKLEGSQILNIINQIGIMTEERFAYDQAIRYYEMILDKIKSESFDNSDELKFKEFAYHNIGKCLGKLGEFGKAKFNLKLALDIKKSYPDLFNDYNMFNSYFNLGEVYYLTENFDSANYFFSVALPFAKEFNIGGDKERFRIHQLYSKSLAKVGLINLALEQQSIYDNYMEEYLYLKEQIAIENQKLNIDLITKRYFSEAESSSEIKASFQWIAVVSGLIILALISIISAMIYRSKQLRRNIESELKTIMTSTPDSN